MYVILITLVSALIVCFTIVSYKKYKKFLTICIDHGEFLLYMLFTGNYSSYITNDVKKIEILLNNKNSMEKHINYRFLKDYIANALLTADGSIGHKKRKLLSKAFKPGILNSFFPIFSEKYQILANIIKHKNEDIVETFSNYTMDVFLCTHIGISFDVQRQKLKLVDYISQLETIATYRMKMPLYWKDYIFYNLSIGRKASYMLKYLDDYLLKIVKTRRESNTCSFENKSWKSLMDILIEPSDQFQFSDYDIVKELILFTTAATNTSATTIAMTFVLLGMHKNIEDKVYNEIIDVIGTDREITNTDLHKLKYTDMVINESMRLFPPLPLVGRNLTGDIDIGTKILAKGLNVLISIFFVHRSEKYWPNPLEFDPNRFLPEEITKRPACSFMPFSAGPRNCLGATYARMLVKYTVANIVRLYKLSSNYKKVDDIKVEMNITLKLNDKLNVSFTPRTENN